MKIPKRSVLKTDFYCRDTLQVARELLGKVLAVKGKSGVYSWGRIVETEAYQGQDPASHSARGRTPRSAIMFGPPGVAYVYFIYGMYEMLNFVTEPEGQAGAVLIRAVEPLGGKALDFSANGPGRLTRAFNIKMADNGASLHGPRFYVFDDGFKVERISASPRVGIRVATEKDWRYFLHDHPCVSRAPQNRLARDFRVEGGG